MKTAYRALLAVMAWAVLAAQYYVNLTSGEAKNFADASLMFFGYFTILTNIGVALAFSVAFLKPGHSVSRFFSRPAVRAALLLYISVVAVVYNVALAADHNPTGIGAVTNLFLHGIIPAAYLVDWVVFADKKPMFYRNIPWWVVYPVLYGVFNIVRGLATGFWPYPFVNVTALGWGGVAVNMAGFTAFFAVGAVVLITVGHCWPNRQKTA